MFEEKIAALNNAPAVIPESPKVEKRVYTVEEVQDILQVSKTTAYALVRSGIFHVVKVGGQHRVSKKSFDEWLDNLGGEEKTSQGCD